MVSHLSVLRRASLALFCVACGIACGTGQTVRSSPDPQGTVRTTRAAVTAVAGVGHRVTDIGQVAVSSTGLAAYSGQHAMDGDDKSGWCAQRSSPPQSIPGPDDTGYFHDSWEVSMSPQDVGALHMKSGWYNNPGSFTGTYKIRDFVWAYQQAGSSTWKTVPNTRLYADRNELVFRFSDPDEADSHALHDVVKMRILNLRDPQETAIVGSNEPCLREVSFYDDDRADIPLRPWFLSIATWYYETPALMNIYQQNGLASTHGNTARFDWNQTTIDHLLQTLGHQPYADSGDEVWIGQFNGANKVTQVKAAIPGRCASPASRTLVVDGVDVPDCLFEASTTYPDWIMHEPIPAGVLLSGNLLEFHDIPAAVLSGFYYFLRDYASSVATTPVPILGGCGGHHLLGMALFNDQYSSWEHDLSFEAPEATDSTRAYHICNRLWPDGSVPTPRTCGEWTPVTVERKSNDVIFDRLPSTFPVVLSHHGLLDPQALAPAGLSWMAGYPGRDISAAPTARQSTTVQAFRVNNRNSYGAQFHWDLSSETSVKQPGIAYRNMETFEKNFELTALNLVQPTNGVGVYDGSGTPVAEVIDGNLDPASTWCASGAATTLEVRASASPLAVRQFYLFGGMTGDVGQPTVVTGVDTSDDGVTWTQRRYRSDVASTLIGKYRTASGIATGADNGNTLLVTLHQSVRANRFRVSIAKPGADFTCVRELSVLPEFGHRLNTSSGALATIVTPDWQPVRADFDGDGLDDFAKYDKNTGRWEATLSQLGQSFDLFWGEPASGNWTPLPGDYDGDGKTDPAVWNSVDGHLWIMKSSGGFTYAPSDSGTFSDISFPLSTPSNWIPFSGRFDSDSTTDYGYWNKTNGNYTVYNSTGGSRSGTWPSGGGTSATWELRVGDLDGDGQSELVVWRKSNGEWWSERSTASWSYVASDPATYYHAHWGDAGGSTWVPLIADFDGDGRDDFAIWKAAASPTTYAAGDFWVAKASAGFSGEGAIHATFGSGGGASWKPFAGRYYRPTGGCDFGVLAKGASNAFWMLKAAGGLSTAGSPLDLSKYTVER